MGFCARVVCANGGPIQALIGASCGFTIVLHWSSLVVASRPVGS
jgi:hypothetical protein